MKPGSCLVQEVETSTTPGSATAAAKAMLEGERARHPVAGLADPISAIRSGSTSGRAAMASTTGVSTASQSCRNGIPCRNRLACWPGPSKVMAWWPRSFAARPPNRPMCEVAPSLPLFRTTSGRRSPGAASGARKK
jgi:hypothetical protein